MRIGTPGRSSRSLKTCFVGLVVLGFCLHGIQLLLRGRDEIFSTKQLQKAAETKPEPPGADTKYILFWNEAYGGKHYNVGFGKSNFAKCKVNDCFTTSNRSHLADVSKYDVILFHQRSMSHSDLPAKRTPGQRYIMWMMEAPANLYGFQPDLYASFFNWTMTYRRDSDFFRPWALPRSLKDPIEKADMAKRIEEFGKANKHLAGKKTKHAAWFVSNCGAIGGRDSYVKELQKWMNVDVYGDCGPFKCPRSDFKKCWDMAERDYFFYFSFENSLCQDYVTEKFIDPLSRNIVPVVMGGGLKEARSSYADTMGAPPLSFINALDYGSPKELAHHLLSLQKNPAKYAEHFWWKEMPLTSGKVDRMDNFCDVCERLHNPDEPKKVYEKLKKWWVNEAHCHTWRH